MSLVLRFIILVNASHFAVSVTITEPPRGVTTLVGSVAVFGCTAVEYDLLQWTRQGITITEQTKQLYQISIVYHNVSDGAVSSSSLYINATIENDGVAIGCRVIAYSPFHVLSIGARLHVRRISPVRDLLLPIDGLTVTWTIPSVIAPDISVSDIRYTVTLEGGNINSTVNDIDDTHYQFTDITVLNCTVYNVTVAAYDSKHYSYNSDSVMAKNDLRKRGLIG